jgi:hypothetical protein
MLPSPIGDAQPYSAVTHVPRPSRIPVEARVMLNPDNDAVHAIVCDVSERGLKIAVNRPLEAGPISVKLPGLPIFTAEVRWHGAQHIGIRFLRPVPWDYLTTWVQMHGLRAKD